MYKLVHRLSSFVSYYYYNVTNQPILRNEPLLHEWVQWVQYDNGTMAHQAVGMEPLLEHAVSMEIEGAADQLYRMAHDQGAY